MFTLYIDGAIAFLNIYVSAFVTGFTIEFDSRICETTIKKNMNHILFHDINQDIFYR